MLWGGLLFFHKVLGLMGLKKGKEFGMIWAEKVDSRPIFHI